MCEAEGSSEEIACLAGDCLGVSAISDDGRQGGIGPRTFPTVSPEDIVIDRWWTLEVEE